MSAALVINAPGINCDAELGRAFELAGAHAEFIHLNRLMDEPELIERFDLIGLPGGFSYGDAIAAGRIMAALIRQRLYRPLVEAVERGVPIFAPCNGFQIALESTPPAASRIAGPASNFLFRSSRNASGQGASAATSARSSSPTPTAKGASWSAMMT
jgi:phosphoribosylformylglycinamidine (FGAM) synthase-like amidotransferase family enzyme